MDSVLIVGNFLSATDSTRSVGEELTLRLRTQGWSVLSCSSKKIRIARLFDMLWTTISKVNSYSIAIVEVYSGNAFYWAECVSFLLKLLRKTYVLVLHGGGLPEFALHNPGRIANLLRSANAVVTPSKWIASSMVWWRPDIRVIPNAIELACYPFRLRETAVPYLCWLRAFHDIYAPWITVEVLDALRNDFPDIKLDMIGPDKKDGSFEKTLSLIHQNGVENNVHIVGGVPKADVPNWLEKADIFLNTTRYESFGVAVLEAAACGLPIVSTGVGELPYLWQNENNALLVPLDDSKAMAKAVRRILTEPGLAERLSSNARKKAEQYDWSLILPEWISTLDSLISRPNE